MFLSQGLVCSALRILRVPAEQREVYCAGQVQTRDFRSIVSDRIAYPYIAYCVHRIIWLVGILRKSCSTNSGLQTVQPGWKQFKTDQKPSEVALLRPKFPTVASNVVMSQESRTNQFSCSLRENARVETLKLVCWNVFWTLGKANTPALDKGKQHQHLWHLSRHVVVENSAQVLLDGPSLGISLSLQPKGHRSCAKSWSPNMARCSSSGLHPSHGSSAVTLMSQENCHSASALGPALLLWMCFHTQSLSFRARGCFPQQSEHPSVQEFHVSTTNQNISIWLRIWLWVSRIRLRSHTFWLPFTLFETSGRIRKSVFLNTPNGARRVSIGA